MKLLPVSPRSSGWLLHLLSISLSPLFGCPLLQGRFPSTGKDGLLPILQLAAEIHEYRPP
ncbi:hypothetical protein SK128_028356 [Halocaridina rubra]|uniref:Uncharacterized protein n=1 Tax=Halocaridina rubra TaxID=373956 RepID=A0AAN8WPT1_HALRR